jgi:hypothetical protein
MTISCKHLMSAALFFMAILAAPITAAAFGALAVGEPVDIAKRGVAVGFARNFATKAEAEAQALKKCLGFQGAPPDTRALCKVVKTFEKLCFAIALDPKAGTPGFGWSIGATRAEAERSAMNKCNNTAGKGRQKFCQVNVKEAGCDGEASTPPQSN